MLFLAHYTEMLCLFNRSHFDFDISGKQMSKINICIRT